MTIARGAGWASKTFLRKSGETLPGRVLLKLAPNAITQLAAGKIVLLVSATNGKTSSTKALVKIVSGLGEVTTSPSGSNLAWGAANALMNPAPYAVLEVDELHLPRVMAESQPKVVLLLNLTRDQLHRMHEVKRVADRWHDACTKAMDTTFVIDVDDPFVNYATRNANHVIRVSFGGNRHPDGAACPSCGAYMNWVGGIYDCTCGLTNKKYDHLLPAGSAAYRNATLANIAGEVIGAKPIAVDEAALERSVIKNYSGVEATIRLTKNPASWTEALAGVHGDDVILILNARQVDGIDTSWLWDVSFSGLKGKNVVVTGERALDMAYRLHVEGIESQVVESFENAIKEFPQGSRVSVLAAYTAFFGLVSK
jgi:UDP-N-acetylmuramyl tripeptide synthase